MSSVLYFTTRTLFCLNQWFISFGIILLYCIFIITVKFNEKFCMILFFTILILVTFFFLFFCYYFLLFYFDLVQIMSLWIEILFLDARTRTLLVLARQFFKTIISRVDAKMQCQVCGGCATRNIEYRKQSPATSVETQGLTGLRHLK